MPATLSKAADAGEILRSLRAHRAQARACFEEIREAQRLSRENLATIEASDLVKSVTGHSSLERAIARLERLIESTDRQIADASARLARVEHGPESSAWIGRVR
ncbi:MAG: hypothetical protein AAFX79_02060 [Planctomycetota bacterium]